MMRTFVRYMSKVTTSTLLQDVSNKQKLFVTDPMSPGSIFFLPNGTKIFNKLVHFIKCQQGNVFQEVITPLIFKQSLWEESGHWANYKEDMFKVTTMDSSKESYGLKPMNCPGHCIMFKKFNHSYQELPIRYSDFSPLHRNEPSGSLSGLTRLRKFHQDDGHIFCHKDQIEQEIINCLNMVDLCYGKIFKFNENSSYSINLSTRPLDHFIGDVEVWNHAEDILKKVLEKKGKKWELNEGDGAFYGPKLDIMVPDHNDKKHQVATIQLDFQLPQRFKLKFKNASNVYETPILIHRAVFGSVERFFALLVEHYKGKWPFWLNPFQARIMPVNTKKPEQIEACRRLKSKLLCEPSDLNDHTMEAIPFNSMKFNVDVDVRSESIGFRIKDAILKNYSYLIIVGDEEVKNNNFSIRTREDRTLSHLTEDEIYEKFSHLTNTYQ